jgi:hypothetical protein
MIDMKSYCHRQRMYTPQLSSGIGQALSPRVFFCTQKFAVQIQIQSKSLDEHSSFILYTIVESST